MSKIFLAAGIMLFAAFAIAAWWLNNDDVAAVAERTERVEPVDDLKSLRERLLSLEVLIAEEREARLDLEARLQDLVEGSDRAAIGVPEGPAVTDEDDIERRAPPRRSRDFAAMMRNFEERRLISLVEGGFTENEALRILEQESEAEFKAMQAAWEAQRKGETIDSFAETSSSQSLLRAELGEIEYERYLAARGQPTSIQVTRVMDGSPGSDAGLQPGDQIVSYAGERVYTVGDLRNLTLQGRPDEDVVIEIDRDGVRMQLNVPRGPVGISGAGARIRNMNWLGGG